MNRKKELLEAFFLIILFLFIIAQLVLPETGIGGVLNEGSMAILFFGIGILTKLSELFFAYLNNAFF